jgi:hypothetical protein
MNQPPVRVGIYGPGWSSAAYWAQSYPNSLNRIGQQAGGISHAKNTLSEIDTA